MVVVFQCFFFWNFQHEIFGEMITIGRAYFSIFFKWVVQPPTSDASDASCSQTQNLSVLYNFFAESLELQLMSVTIHVHQSYSSHDITPLGRVLDRKIFSSQAFVQVSPNLEPKLGTESAMSFRTETDKKEAKDSENMQDVAILAIFLVCCRVPGSQPPFKRNGGFGSFWILKPLLKNGGSETNP